MALKINTQLGCDQGITSEAYVRINQYNIDKASGVLNLNFSTYFNEAASKPLQSNMMPARLSNSTGQPIINRQIGENLSIPLKKTITESVTIEEPRMVEKEVEKVVSTTVNGKTTSETVKEMQMVREMVSVTKENIREVPDMSIIAGIDIFEFCYAKLKEKLLESFADVVDC